MSSTIDRLGDHLIERDVGSLVDVPERVDELIAVIDIEPSQVVVVDLSSHGHVPECESNPRPGTWTAGEASGRGWAGHAARSRPGDFILLATPGIVVSQRGDDEANLKFPIECLNAVCELIRPRRRRNVGRVYSAEHLAALAEAGRQDPFPECRLTGGIRRRAASRCMVSVARRVRRRYASLNRSLRRSDSPRFRHGPSMGTPIRET